MTLAEDPLDSLTPQAAETVRWALRQIAADSLAAGEPSPTRFAASNWRSPSRLAYLLHASKHQIGDFVVRAVHDLGDGGVEVELVGRKDHLWSVRLHLDEASRIVRFAILRPLPPGISLRPAVAADWPALAALEAACPTVTASGKLASISRSHALADHFALQGEYALCVAEHDGRIIGARALPIREVSIGWQHRRYDFSHFVRIHPDYQSLGLIQALHTTTAENVWPTTDAQFAYADPANARARAAFGGYPFWSLRPFRAEFDCARLAGPPFGRETTPADAARVMELVNTCHGREAFFSPYNGATLEERLSRAPHAYSWPHIRLSDNAVMGAWLCGERRIVVDGQRRDEMVRGLVLDYGFLPEGEEDFVALVRHWCASANAAGMTHLSIFSSPSSPGADTIRHLAHRIQEFDFAFDEPEPSDLDARGVYVDAIYF